MSNWEHLGERFWEHVEQVNGVLGGARWYPPVLGPGSAVQVHQPLTPLVPYPYRYGPDETTAEGRRQLEREFLVVPFVVLGRHLTRPPGAVGRGVGRPHRAAVNLLRLAHALAATQDWDDPYEPYVGLDQPLPVAVRLENEVTRCQKFPAPERDGLRAALWQVARPLLPYTRAELEAWVADRIVPNQMTDPPDGARVAAPAGPDAGRAKGRRQSKGAGVNARMLVAIQEDRSRQGWSSGRWAVYLGCAASTVVATQAWADKVKPTRVSLKLDRLGREDSLGYRGSRRRG